MSHVSYAGVEVTRTEKAVDCSTEVEKIVDALDEHKGMLMMSTFEYPGRCCLCQILLYKSMLYKGMLMR